jgi:hypothetical protein
LAELQRTIDLRKNEGLATANRVVLEGSGKQTMDQIRAIIAEMANEEKDLLRVRSQETNKSAATSVRTIVIGTLLSISLLVLCFGLLQRELSERKKGARSTGKCSHPQAFPKSLRSFAFKFVVKQRPCFYQNVIRGHQCFTKLENRF